MTDPVLLWLRQDLRLRDQAAVAAATAAGPVIPVYVLDDETPGERWMGGAQRWWLHRSLQALDEALRERGSRLILRRGRAADEIARVAEEVGATTVHALRHYEPWWVAAEDAVGNRVGLCLHDGTRLAPPEAIRTGNGGPYKIFSPYWRALNDVMPPPEPVNAPGRIPAPAQWPASETLAALDLLPTAPDWSGGFAEEWTPGEAGAAARVEAFLEEVPGYAERRNLPSDEGTSRLSPHLHMGEISPADLWHAVADRPGADAFLRELGWRDFTGATMLAFPWIAERNARAGFDRLDWRTGAEADRDFRAWCRGLTGYPIVDAGMRQLWTSGWLHNRVRMIAASFLVKHLLVDWRRGERWFWDTLVDADQGNNGVNWQWIAGTGHDANMFSRIMAPLVQSEKFDAAGYIRRWVPELADVPDAAIHDPHGHGCAPAGYPAPLIGHREGRERALAAGRAVRG